MSRHLPSLQLLLGGVALAGLLAIVPGARTASAQNVNDMVRTLNNIVNPGDAQRLEDQARRNGRPQEQRYWHDYRAGLDSPDRYQRDYGPDYRNGPDYRRGSEGFSGDSGYRRDYRDYRYDQR
jgi:hypothetical protein